MALLDRIFSNIENVYSEEEAASAVEYIVDDVAKEFLTWYRENHGEDWARGLEVHELYEQFKMSL